MTKPLLPQAFWFRLAVDCPRVDEMPVSETSQGLLRLPEESALPGLGTLDGRDSWASVRAGWNPRGLGIAVQAEGAAGQLARLAERPEGFADVNLWIDTRDTRNVSRATRFCHRFLARLTLARDRKGLDVDLSQRAIARSVADAPIADPGLLRSRAELTRGGWRLEVFLPAQALHGYDPDTNRRLGLAYQVSDHERDDQFLGVGRDFPLGENPSLWSTLDLRP